MSEKLPVPGCHIGDCVVFDFEDARFMIKIAFAALRDGAWVYYPTIPEDETIGGVMENEIAYKHNPPQR
jgi:hypothetical protein